MDRLSRVEMQWTHYDTKRCRKRLDIGTGHGMEEVMRFRYRE